MKLTDQLVAALLDRAAALELRVPVVWETRPTALRAHIGVHNVHGLPVVLGAQILSDKPWKFTTYLMLYNTHIRRLDVNGSHKNRSAGRELWQGATHKHRFSEQHQDSEAYTPTDIPSIPLSGVVGEHYREVFEAFCAECSIKLAGAYALSDPIGGSVAPALDEEV